MATDTDPFDCTSQAPSCACLEVKYDPLIYEGAPDWKRWRCASCKTEFVRRSSMKAFWRDGVGQMRRGAIEAIRAYSRENLTYMEKDMDLISHTIDEMVQTLIGELAALDVESEPADVDAAKGATNKEASNGN